ncbi:hypothetical protein NC653_003627 [Populus alba x Populus x berolinensis]|uniref:Malectin-like domain-containing protein n=1 Tax=Populus alba x Populus x berolinensis TaxID=444605 RepID=A0AAD6RS84_9ROSI|nr:hypothetical protein NC653_003627 [Populus alba x Populus x berolinensis]
MYHPKSTQQPMHGDSKKKYLISAGFLYGNYDELQWEVVRLNDASTPLTTEIIHVLSSDNIDICLVITAKITSYAIKSPDDNKYTFPYAIMQRAAVPINHRNPLVFYFQRHNRTNQFFLYMHFAEIGKLPANQTREFNIYVNNKLWHGPIVPT